MRNLIFGGIGVVWGGGIILYSIFNNNDPPETKAGRAGQIAGTITGVLLFGVGLVYFIMGVRAVIPSQPKRRRRRPIDDSRRRPRRRPTRRDKLEDEEEDRNSRRSKGESEKAGQRPRRRRFDEDDD